MLKLGEKGAIPQNQEDCYTIAPHIPCGFVTPELLRKIADVSEKYNAKALKNYRRHTYSHCWSQRGGHRLSLGRSWPGRRCCCGFVYQEYSNLFRNNLLQAWKARC